jgi:putative phage-type endonuclease
MKIIPLEQGSKEWLDWRCTKITSSDAPVILGLNRYSNPRKLYNEKMGLTPPQSTNFHMERGTLFEPIARQLFIEATGIDVTPMVVEHDELSWMGASLDGIDKSRRTIIEIKCPAWSQHENEISPMHRAQMQHHLYATGAEICFYVTYIDHLEQKINIIEVSRDEKSMQEMIKVEYAFYKEFICGFKQPPLRWKYKHAA